MCSEEMKDAFEWSYCFLEVKGSSDPRHLIFEINVGKRRIRQKISKMKWIGSGQTLILNSIGAKNN